MDNNEESEKNYKNFEFSNKRISEGEVLKGNWVSDPSTKGNKN